MNSSSHSDEKYVSTIWCESETHRGVRFGIVRVSFGRRIELARRIREIGRRVEYLEAGQDAKEKLEATVLGAEVDRAYLEWGLVGVEGLDIDGAAATAGSVVDAGPIDLTEEILHRIKFECGLTDDERKN